MLACGLQVPAHLRDSHYQGAKEFGHGDDYKYSHDLEGGWVEQAYLPEDRDGLRSVTASKRIMALIRSLGIQKPYCHYSFRHRVATILPVSCAKSAAHDFGC